MDIKKPWHSMPNDEIFKFVKVEPYKGLSSQEVIKRSRHFGYNPANVFNSKLKHLFRYLVLRDSKRKYIACNQLVVGDIIALKQGDIVPANARLIKVSKLSVDEEYITGNYAPTTKNTLLSKLDSLSHSNMLISGTKVIQGSAIACVVGYDAPAKLFKNKVKQNRLLTDNNFITNKPLSYKKLQIIDAVIFNDLKNIHEVTKSTQAIYLQKNITCIYFLEQQLVHETKTALADAMFGTKDPTNAGVYVYGFGHSSSLLNLLKLITNNFRTLHFSRGDGSKLISSLFDINIVVAKDSQQQAIQQADLVTEKVNYNELAGILYNKK